MEDLAMARVLLPVLLVMLSCLATANDLQKTLEARYRELNNAIKKGDAKAVEAWANRHLAQDFEFESRDKRKYDRKTMIAGLRQQMSVTTKVIHSNQKIDRAAVKGNQATLRVATDFKALVKLEKTELTLTDKIEQTDTWVRVGNDWKLSRTLQTKADTQMFQK
jgi:hypothetical protein